MKKTALLLFTLFLIFSGLPGQNRLKQKGDEAYNQLAYAEAIKWYQRALRKEESPDAILRLADCYRLTNNYEKASEWYAKAVELPQRPPISVFYYGHTLLQQEDYGAARKQFEAFALLAPGDPRGRAYADALEDMSAFSRDSSRYQIANLPFNTELSEFSMARVEGGWIFASSRRDNDVISKEFDWLDQPFLDFFFVPETPVNDSVSRFGRVRRLKGEINSRFHESNFSPPADSGRVYFTRNNIIGKKKGQSSEGVVLLKIYSAERKGLSITNIEEFPFNSDEYSIGHSTLSPEGECIYFASDMPGGEGGTDIWRCQREGDSWAKPENLGKTINTPGNEMHPYALSDGKLFFCSDGHPGLGHMDIFSAQESGKQWSQVTNLGLPINSPYDDFGFWINEEMDRGYFSSNRPGGKGDDDLYSFRLQAVTVDILVLDKVAQLPIENATLRLKDLDSKVESEYKTDENGRIRLRTFPGKLFDGMIISGDFDDYAFPLSTKGDPGQEYFEKTVELYNPPPAITALIVDDNTKERLPGAKASFHMISPKDTTVVRIADRNGRIAIKLGLDAKYKLTVSRKGYLSYTSEVNTSYYTYDGDTIIPLKMEKLEVDKPIVLKNINYDFDQWTIRYDAYDDLLMVTRLMKENPEIRIELSSHTDSRGDDEYNRRLSHKRAVAARIFIIDRGVDPSRIEARGYGESQLLNRCGNGVRCSENEHFANRRTEFKVIGFIEGIDQENSVLETGKLPVKEKENKPENKKSSKLTVREPVNKLPVKGPVSKKKSTLESIEAAFSKPTVPTMKYNSKLERKREGMMFRVQIQVGDLFMKDAELAKLAEYEDYAFYKHHEDKIKYFVGEFADYKSAENARKAILGYGFKQAVVTGWLKGEQISEADWRKLMR